MANFVRRLVSGDKARFRDDELNLELDLVYVTDRIIIMGYPASSLESMYRNSREDAKKFLDHRHGNNYWIFNLCPLQENSYPSSAFGGRVSRYPFPDHHAPPLAVLPLVTREIRIWLDGSPDRVAVLHCKAGKGRSGTLACAFLLSLDENSTAPRLERNHTQKDWSKARADKWMQVVEEEGVLDAVESTATEKAIEADKETSPDSSEPSRHNSRIDLSKVEVGTAAESGETTNAPVRQRSTLESILALHTERRMRTPTSKEKKQKAGVSIPSQKRWLYYWSQILSGSAPPGFWALSPLEGRTKHQARILSVTI